jgi:hypothetical protein
MTIPGKAPLHVFDRRFYAKVALASAAVGAGMEWFMIKTGFYDKCVRIGTALVAPVQRARARNATGRADLVLLLCSPQSHRH